MESKDFRVINGWDSFNIFSIFVKIIIRIIRDFVFVSFFGNSGTSFANNFSEAMFFSENGIFDIIFNVRVKEFSI
jgi:hypothetical protein